MIRGLAIAATEFCMNEAKNEAWMWEDKFAELIISECIAVSKKAMLDEYGKPIPADKLISLHFGVK